MPTKTKKVTKKTKPKETETYTVLRPSPAVLSKLGSLVSHVEEHFSPDGHYLDKLEIEMLLQDKELQQWLAAARKLSFISIPRKMRTPG